MALERDRVYERGTWILTPKTQIGTILTSFRRQAPTGSWYTLIVSRNAIEYVLRSTQMTALDHVIIPCKQG